MRGWIKIHRSICDNWIFQRPDYFRAWINLLVRANHKEKKKLFNNSLVTINRGEVVSSLSAFSKKWNMTIGRTRHFLQLLEKDQMILKKNGRDFTHLSICNYETYQDLQHAHSTLTAHSQQIHNKSIANPSQHLKNVKNVKKERKKENARGDFEIQKALFDKLRERFGLMEDHYPAYRHHIEAMILRWKDKTEFLVDAFISDSDSEIRDLRYLCEQGIDKYAAPQIKRAEFKKTPNGEFVAYCKKCGQQLFFPNLKSINTSSDCHAADLVATRPTNGMKYASTTNPKNISPQP